MRATRAYITSFGTTGLLIASALLSLSVMSAFVAFRGFPGEDVQAPIQTLLVQEHQTPVRVPAKPLRVGVLGAKRSPSAGGSRRTATRRVSSPTASTGPVVQRTAPAAPAPAPNQAPSNGTSSGNATPVADTSPLTSPTTAPTVPSTSTLPLPSLTLPSLPPPPPPDSSQLPVDTSGVTGLLGG